MDDQYCSPNVIRVIKSRRIKGVENVAFMDNRRDSWWEDLSARDYLRDLHVHVRMILE